MKCETEKWGPLFIERLGRITGGDPSEYWVVLKREKRGGLALLAVFSLQVIGFRLRASRVLLVWSESDPKIRFVPKSYTSDAQLT